jgi:hypothetical protein
MTPHPQAEILRAIADGLVVQHYYQNRHPYKDWQDYVADEHSKFSPLFCDAGYKWRIKPAPTITIGTNEVPEPMRVAPTNGVTYWGVFLSAPCIDIGNWHGMDCEVQWLKTGLLQSTEQGAKDMLAALVKQLGGSHE